MIGKNNIDDSEILATYQSSKVYTFDFDGTLNNSFYTNGNFNQDLTPKIGMIDMLRNLKRVGHIVYIVSSRYVDSLKDVYHFVNQHSLTVDGVIGTNGKLKAETLLKLGSQYHFDDSIEEIENNLYYGVNSFHVK